LLLYNKAILTNASREGARQGIVFFADPVTGAYSPKTEEEIQNVVNAYANNYLITFGANPPVTPTTTASWDPSQTSGAILAVNVQYTYTFLILPSFMSGMLGDTLDLGAETVMRME
jgi:hypothetical protein